MLDRVINQMNTRRWLLLIVVLSVCGRLAFILLFDHTLSLQTSGYDTYAVNVMEGRGYTRFEDRSGDSDLPPLYPYFLIGVYSTLGRDPIAVALVQIGLDVLVLLLLFWLGRRIEDTRVGLLAAAFYGLYPYLLFQNLTLNDTGVFILFLVGAVAAAYRARDTQDWRWAVVVGVALGLGALTKTLAILLLPLLALWWWHLVGFRQAFVLGIAAALALVAVTGPWIIRNSRLHNELVLISTNGGSNLHQGNNPCAADYLARGWDAQWVNCLAPVPPGLSETGEAHWHQTQALDYLRDHVDQWPRLFWTKFWVLWSPAIMPYDLPPDAAMVDDAVLQYNTRTFDVARIVHVIYFTPLLMLGIAGLALGWRGQREIAPLVAVFVVITVTYVVFHPSTRYRSPADPFVFILSAISVARLWAQIKAFRGRRAARWQTPRSAR